MKNAILAMLLLVPMSAMAQFKTGNDIRQWVAASDRIALGTQLNTDYQDKAKLIGYVMGVVDATNWVPRCIPANATIGQMVAVVAKYLRDNPNEWEKDAALIISQALNGAFPCNSNPPPN